MYNNEFYKSVKKPGFTPSPKVFKYTWTVLYILMFSSAYIVFISPVSEMRIIGLKLFIIQTFLNFLWGPVFFYFKRIDIALIISTLLAIFSAVTALYFFKVSILAFSLFLPYVFWLFFAAFLNYCFYKLNT